MGLKALLVTSWQSQRLCTNGLDQRSKPDMDAKGYRFIFKPHQNVTYGTLLF
jgi:predicted transcriptional regulator